MKLRKRHRQETELFTDSLNDILFILLMFFLITTTMANPNVVKVNNPRGTKDTKAKQNIVVSIDKNQQFYIGQKLVDRNNLDTVLTAEILKWKQTIDTPTVVVNADTIAYYGEVFRVMRVSKRSGAKVVANVK
ncbi:MAG TPA: biopolymer transporter ExbD [Chitinophagaceae bacterium]|jgi:biopolymer transport protein ExbD